MDVPTKVWFRLLEWQSRILTKKHTFTFSIISRVML